MAESTTTSNNLNAAGQPYDDAAATEEVSAELDAMVCDVLDEFLNALADGDDPDVLLCVEDASAARYEAAFAEDGPQACIDGARHFVEMNQGGLPSDHVGPIDRYAIAYAGAVELDGEFADAIIVSFYQRGMANGYSAYLLYSGAGTGEHFMWSDPEPAGEEPPLI